MDVAGERDAPRPSVGSYGAGGVDDRDLSRGPAGIGLEQLGEDVRGAEAAREHVERQRPIGDLGVRLSRDRADAGPGPRDDRPD